jgi:hypothetical protein
MTVIMSSLVALVAIAYIVTRLRGYHLHIDRRSDDEIRRCHEIDQHLRELGY